MCKHINQIFEQHEGFITCTDCGQVLDIYFVQQEDSVNNFKGECISDIKSYLTECCERMNIPNAILEVIYSEYVHFRSENEFKKINDMQLMAYSIYFSLKNENIGRNIEYVSQNTGVSSKLLWKCESLDPYLSTPINIESLLVPLYSFFDLCRNFANKQFET